MTGRIIFHPIYMHVYQSNGKKRKKKYQVKDY